MAEPSDPYTLDYGDDDSISSISRRTYGEPGLRELVLSVNQTLTTMNVTLKRMQTELEDLHRPVKRRNSEEKTKVPLAVNVEDGAIFGDPRGTRDQSYMVIKGITREQILDAERKVGSVEQLAVELLFLLFSEEELRTGNCTKPTRSDISILDSVRLWAIRCHLDYEYPMASDGDDVDVLQSRRWKDIKQLTLNPKCRKRREKK